MQTYQDSTQCIVLGGDTFDFKWSRAGDLAASIDAALTWLSELLAQTGKCQVFYLLGNHDCLPEYFRALESFSNERRRIHIVDHALQLGDCLFLHGDLIDAGTESQLSNYRAKFHHREPKPLFMHWLYDLVVQLRIPGPVSRLVRPTARTCEVLNQGIDSLTQVDGYFEPSEIRKVFFGHTHVMANGHNIGARTYYNPGSGIKHMNFQPMTFSLRSGSSEPKANPSQLDGSLSQESPQEALEGGQS